MNRTFATTGALALVAAALAAACSSSNISAGNDHLDGKFTTGWACACPNGATTCNLVCPDSTQGSCSNGQPYCDVTQGDAGLACACANGQTSCSITCPDGTQGECSNGVPTCGGTVDAGNCCPAGWDLYACTWPDGGAGQACHNPQLGCASSTTCGQGCDQVVTGQCGGGGDSGPQLQWYTSCGYPVCGGGSADGGVVSFDAGDTTDSGAACPTEGTPCSVAGEMCGTASQSNCGVVMVCAASDPKQGPGGCPISTRKYKNGIEYVNDTQLRQLHDETMGIRLATYQYKPQVADPGPTHFGFIVEDNLQTPAVDPMHDRVDMYGYVSMVVAAMQVQEKEIAELRAEVASCKGSVTKP
ncbi:MAG TPA: hypothetical protein VF765_12795 [Polyangiaceae bacterium]